MRLIAHRGFAAEYPENTLTAVRRAAERAGMIEVDVRRCGSGEIVVIHDATVDRVTDGEGRVGDHTRDELGALSVLGAGEGVPTLAEVVDTLPPGTGLNVELKEAGIAADALAAVRPVGDDLVVSSFSAAALRECRAADPGVPLAYLVGEGSGIGAARDLGCAYVHPHHDLCDPGYVERAHGAGLSVNAWTVADRETARSLADAGVDGVIADRADVVP